MLIAVLHFLPHHEQAAIARQMIEQGKADAYPRTHAQFGEFFAGLDLVEPGIVPVSEWHPTVPADRLPAREDVAFYAAVGRKP